MIYESTVFNVLKPKSNKIIEKNVSKLSSILKNKMMMRQIECENIETTKILLDFGADVNYHDSEGNTGLMITSFIGNMELVKLLIKYGTDINRKNVDGYTALTFANENEHHDITEYLIKIKI